MCSAGLMATSHFKHMLPEHYGIMGNPSVAISRLGIKTYGFKGLERMKSREYPTCNGHPVTLRDIVLADAVRHRTVVRALLRT